VKAEPRLIPTGHGIPARFADADAQKGADADDDDSTWLPLHSVFLAEEKELALLVDDRSCQMLVHNDRRTATAVFATEAVLSALLEESLITADTAADAYLRLIAWRYRFLVVPPEALVVLAKRNLTTPPGNPLRQVARYVQDCMRDPGLFGGLEPTDPPLSMAQKLFLTWTTNVTEFVMAVGTDDTIPPEAARVLIEWALTECLPSPPPVPGQGGPQPHPPGWTWAEQQPRLLLGQAFVKAAAVRQPERVNVTLVMIAKVLGIRDRDYLQEIAEVADAL
jgi:hypothetical protein